MILLKLIFDNFWGDSDDVFSLRQFSTTLSWHSSITIKVKDYHYNNDFFYIVVQASIITFCIYKSGYNTFKVWLSKNNWPKLLEFITNLSLALTTVHKFWSTRDVKISIKVDTILATKKETWLANRQKGQCQPNWINQRIELTKSFSKNVYYLV